MALSPDDKKGQSGAHGRAPITPTAGRPGESRLGQDIQGKLGYGEKAPGVPAAKGGVFAEVWVGLVVLWSRGLVVLWSRRNHKTTRLPDHQTTRPPDQYHKLRLPRFTI